MGDFNENMGGLLNPDNAFEYTKVNNFLFTYKDSLNNVYFLQLIKEPFNRYHEILIGWFDSNNKMIFEPALPTNIDSKDNNKRGNTVAKIFRDELLPLIEKNNFCFSIKTMDNKRNAFSKRLLLKFFNTDKNVLKEFKNNFFVSKKTLQNKKASTEVQKAKR